MDETNQPLPGASIVVKGTTNGTSTDFDGKFSITVSDENAILVISYLGFLTEEVTINNQTTINIVLQVDSAQLDEVVVIGYGTQKRKDLTGSIASIQATQISSRPIASVEEALQGLVPGINIAQRISQG